MSDVAGRVALSGTIDVLRAIAGAAGPRHWIVALGYAGWGEGQLEEEMTRHGWFSTTGDVDLIYATEARARWTRGFETSGIDPRLITRPAGRAGGSRPPRAPVVSIRPPSRLLHPPS